MKSNTLAIALASLLVGGVAVAAFQNNRERSDYVATGQEGALAADAAFDSSIPSRGRLEYAQVVDVKPLTEKQDLYAQVIGTEPVRESSTTSAPRQVCEDVAVQERLPERDGNVGGTVAGALIGGLVGNQVGDGRGRTAATVAGAVAGGAIGKNVDENDRFERYRDDRGVETRCRTVQETRPGREAYRVTYTYGGQTYETITRRHPGRSLPVVVEVRPQDDYLADGRRR
jgi:uncharacterized protein YcfJ